MRLITSFVKEQMRLGYLNCLVLVAGRQLDSHGGLLRRFEEFILREIDPKDPEYNQHMSLFDPDYRKQKSFWNDDHYHNFKSRISGQNRKPERNYLHGFWLKHAVIGGATGIIAPGNCKQILKMARNIGFIGSTYALTELGVLLRGLLLIINPNYPKGLPELNPFHLWQRQAIALTLLYALLRADIVLPFLVNLYAEDFIISESKGIFEEKPANEGDIGNKDSAPKKLLPQIEHSPMYLIPALDKLIGGLRRDLPIDQTLLLKEVVKLRSRFDDYERDYEKIKNHFYPRRQHLIDLGLLKRVKGTSIGTDLFLPTLITKRAANAWRELRENPLKQDSLIEKNFFRWAAEIYGLSRQRAKSDLMRLDYFARGFPLVSREIGFTPGRTVALAGCLLAIEEGIIIEVNEMFEMMAEMAKSLYRPYLHYSGGSRLDREFLIRVDVEPLRARLKQEGVKLKAI